MAEQKNIRRKDTKDFNYDKYKAKQEKKLRDRGSITLNKWQEMHLRGEIDVYAPIPQEDGGEPLPPLAVQWKEDAKRRFGNANTSNR
jgi:hypothetical protein